MRTVKEISALTGISVRTLHWYDEIGLLRPTAHSEAGYRLYDDKALETLQQILFFREFELPLMTIKSILEDPALDRDQILLAQRQMLERKAARIARMIEGIDGILKGENRMDFEVFKREEIEEIYRAQLAVTSAEALEVIARKFGGMEAYHDYFMEQAGGEAAQRQYQKMVEWYGGKDEMLEVVLHPHDSKIMRAYGRRVDAVMDKLAQRRGEDVLSFAVKGIVGEYEFVMKQLFRVQSVREMLLKTAAAYRRGGEPAARIDGQYGPGTAEFMSRAIKAYYGVPENE